MKNRHLRHQGWKILTAALIVLLAGGWLTPKAVAAGDLDKLDTSLKLIPADAAFYSSLLRNREQLEALLHSNAWAKIMAMPSVQMGLAMFNGQAQQPGSPAAQGLAALENPEIKKLLDLAIDMGSNEIFFYGGENINVFAELAQSVVSKMRYGPILLQAAGEGQAANGEKLQAKLLLEALIENLDKVVVPDVVVGFRLNNPAAANEALIKLETIVNLTMEAQPMLKGHFNKEKIDKYEYLALRLNGEMIPWDALPLDEWKQLVDDENDWQKLVDHIKKMEFYLVLGVRDNYLLVSLGSSLDGIKNLGSTERLIDQPEFAPLKKFLDKRLVSVGYVSKDLNEQLNNSAKQIDDLHDFLVQLLPLANLTDEQNEQIGSDAEKLADNLKDMLPEIGAGMGFEFLTENGYEGYRYAWGKHPGLDGSQPLGLLKHVGGNPLLGILGRGKVSIEDYDIAVKWAKVGWKYVNELLLPNIPEGDREKAKAFLDDLAPLLVRFNKAYRDMLLPALADGQFGLVIDAKLKSKQIHNSLPVLDKNLPIIEPALIVGVSNADLLRKAISEIYAVCNDSIDLIRKHQPEAIPPDFKLPQPKLVKQSGGMIYSYPLPQEWGVDKNIVPNAGLADDVAVLTLSTQHTQRLLKETPLKVGGVLLKTDKPLAVAVWLDCSELLNAGTPWAEYVLERIPEEQLGGQKQLVIGQVKTLLEVLRVIKSFTSETYLEDKCFVTHSQLEIHDLGK